MAKPKEDKRRPVSDAGRALWRVHSEPFTLALHQLTQAIANSNQLTAGRMMQVDGMNPAEWALDADRMEWVRRDDIK